MYIARSSFFKSIAVAAVLGIGGLVCAADYNVDPVHSHVLFRIKHLNTSQAWGVINGPSGKLVWDDENLEKSSLDVSVNPNNISTGNATRDGHLKGPDFFGAKQFPKISFKSTAIKKAGDDKFDVTGDLSLHGVTKSITVTLEKTGTGKGQRGEPIVGFETTFTIKRSDYDMTKMIGPVGDDVRITVAIEAGSK